MWVVVVTLSWVVPWIWGATPLFQSRVTPHLAAAGLCCTGDLLETVILRLETVIYVADCKQVLQKSDVKPLCCVTRMLVPPEPSRKVAGTWLNRAARGLGASLAGLNRCKTMRAPE